MIPVSTLFPEVHLRAAEAPEEATRLALARAAELFCRETWAWYREAHDFEIEGDTLLVPPPDAQTIPIALTGLWVSKRRIPRVCHDAWCNSRQLPPSWPPRAYYVARPDMVRFIGAVPEDKVEQAEREVHVVQVLAPSREATVLPEWMVNEYASALVSGALYYLATIPGAPCADPGSAASYKAEMLAGISMARRHRSAGYTDSTLAVAPRPLARGSQR